MPRTHSALAAVVATALLSTGNSALAQDIRWRHDYAAARREATETGRPLLLDVGTEACFWCKKLDATTLRDPNVVKLLNERFIPVKIDGAKHERLTAALGVEGFPALVLATPDGKVAGRHAGYADVAQLTALLNKAPAPNAPTPVVASPVRPVEAEAERLRRLREQIDAGLAALRPKIAAALDR